MIAAVLFAMVSPAYAYLDPGTGSVIVQALLAMLVGAGLFFRNLRDYVTGLFLRRKPVQDEQSTGDKNKPGAE